jgi:hypothetical protein
MVLAGVSYLGVNAVVLLDVVESVFHESAHAAEGGVVAVNNVLKNVIKLLRP